MTRPCLIRNCSRTGRRRRFLCDYHYYQWLTDGKPETWHGHIIPPARSRARRSKQLIRVMRVLQEAEGMPFTLEDLSVSTGLSEQSVSRITRQLAGEGRVHRTGGRGAQRPVLIRTLEVHQ